MKKQHIALITLIVTLAMPLCIFGEGSTPEAWPTVGIESSVSATFPRGDLEVGGTRGSITLILRIADIKADHDGYLYDLRYIGLLPGTYNLSDCLLTPEGDQPAGLPSVPVEVLPLLPPEHDGSLVSQQLMAHTLPGGYKLFFSAIWLLWALLLIPLSLLFRRRGGDVVEPPPPPPTLAELIKPLVEKAVSGELSVSGKEHLERLLTGYWRRELNLDHEAAYQMLIAIKRHPEAGKLFEQLECWLHRPPESRQVNIDELLKPYMTITMDSERSEDRG